MMKRNYMHLPYLLIVSALFVCFTLNKTLARIQLLKKIGRKKNSRAISKHLSYLYYRELFFKLYMFCRGHIPASSTLLCSSIALVILTINYINFYPTTQTITFNSKVPSLSTCICTNPTSYAHIEHIYLIFGCFVFFRAA